MFFCFIGHVYSPYILKSWFTKCGCDGFLIGLYRTYYHKYQNFNTLYPNISIYGLSEIQIRQVFTPDTPMKLPDPFFYPPFIHDLAYSGGTHSIPSIKTPK